MSTGIFRSFNATMLLGGINLATDDIGLLLVNEQYVPDFMRHTRRSDVEPFEAIGAGYVKGAVKSTATLDYTPTGLTVTLGGGRLPTASVRARGCVYFINHGGDPSEDELLFYNEFLEVMECTRGILNISPSVINFN